MSYLVTDVMADYTDRSTGNRQVRASIVADTAADLPANTTALTWLLGSYAKTVDTGDEYWIDSSGSWILQPSSVFTSNYYTKAETDGILSAHVCQCDTAGNVADKVATTSDDFVLREGAIIAVKFAYTNTVSDNAYHPITINVNDTGAYRVYYQTGELEGTTQTGVFGAKDFYIYYVFHNDRWVWMSFSRIYFPTLMTQAEASAGTSTNVRSVNAKVLHDTIIEQTTPLKSALTDIINSGGKNRFNATGASTSSRGFTITNNGDGTFTVNGTRNAPDSVWFALGTIDLNGHYFLSGTSTNEVRLTANVGGVAQYDDGSGADLDGVINGTVYANIPPTVNELDNVVIYPMICSYNDWLISQTFEPYCPTLAELYALVRSYHP